VAEIIHALRLAEITRHPKKYVCRLSDRWSEVRTRQDALAISILSREHCNDAGVQPSHAEDVAAAAVA
jgi:hypothetical protein